MSSTIICSVDTFVILATISTSVILALKVLWCVVKLIPTGVTRGLTLKSK